MTDSRELFIHIHVFIHIHIVTAAVTSINRKDYRAADGGLRV